MEAISVKNLTKEYKTKIIDAKKGFLQYIFPTYTNLQVIKSINFRINCGERVAFIGPNGAGKSTTIKILTGITQPSQGVVKILGRDPLKSRKYIPYKIGVIFGQTSQLWQDLAVKDSFELIASLYEISSKEYRHRINKLSNLFGIELLHNREVRQLSLGQRMRCEIVASLLHNPEILFLDEPTIGLDINAKSTIRNLVKKLAIEENKTLLLTSHDTDDIEKVCDRVIIMNQGIIVYDGTLETLKSDHILTKIINIRTDVESFKWELKGTKVILQEPYNLKIAVELSQITIELVINELLKRVQVKDLTIENPPLESIISSFYK